MMTKAKFYGLFALAALAAPHTALAAAAGGNMPWDTGLTNIRQDLTGPTAYSITIMLIAVTGFLLWRGGDEMTGIVRGLIGVVFVGALLMLSTQMATALGFAGAVVS